MDGERPHVVFVHGGLHGGWCFGPLRDELVKLGIESLAVDLPIDDPDAGSDAYCDAILEATKALENIVLVGHSMGGLVLPVVASRRQVERMIFVCGVLPIPGKSVVEQFADEPTAFAASMGALVPDDSGRLTMAADDVRSLWYHDCPQDTVNWVVANLRPQGTRSLTETCPLDRWPDTPSSYILCTDDRSVPPTWARSAVPARLGVTPQELPGGHSPFLSRPGALAATIADICAQEDTTIRERA